MDFDPTLASRGDPLRPANLRWRTWLLALGWTLSLAVSLWQSWRLLQHSALNLAVKEASNNLAEDLAYRHWATLQGGVYVPVTPETPPNTYLASMPERDLTTPSGRHLTLVNPEYMTRLVFADAGAQFGVRAHLTSLKPLRQQDAADEWEAAALRACEAGQKEFGAIGDIAGQPHYRLMRPMLVEGACLRCHAAQGYRLGEIRGGISVAVPLAPHQAMARAQFIPIASRHAVVWVLGLAALALSYRQTRRRVAERHRAEAALRQSEKRQRSLLGNIPDSAWLKDVTGRYLAVNQAWCKQFGLREARVLGKTDFDLLPPEVARSFAAEDRALLASGRAMQSEKPFDDPVRGHRWVEVFITPLLDDKGTIVSTAGIARDITERKQAAAALRDSEALYQSLVSHLSQCVFRKDRAGRFTFANERFCQFLGKTLGEIQGHTDLDFFPRELVEKYRQDDQRVMQERLAEEDVEETALPNGERIFVQVVKTPLVNVAGEVVGVQGIFWDITERRRVEAERERLLVELRSALASVKTLRGLVPICAGCKKIRDDKGFWSEVENYVAKHTDARFTHGLCPDCCKKYYPGMDYPPSPVS
jgi:two-component system, cell cycle sensor histidine kinase and response regulator CckA